MVGVLFFFGGCSGKGWGESKVSKDCRNLVLFWKFRVEVVDIDLWFDYIIMLSYYYLCVCFLVVIGEFY